METTHANKLAAKEDNSVEHVHRKNNISQSKLDIERRLVRLNFDDIKGVGFYQQNIVLSAFWVALSATFPPGETEFIASVKLFEDRIDDEDLGRKVSDFAAQEAHHSLQHRRINQQFERLGFGVGTVENIMHEKIFDRNAKWSDEKRLMRTVAAEHITAVMAHFALTQVHVLESMPVSLRQLLEWHAVEEIEHKSVAFDVYQHCVGKSWWQNLQLKSHYIAFTFFEFPRNMFFLTRYLLQKLEVKADRKAKREMRQFLFSKDGMIGSVWKHYLAFLRPKFHPWQLDDSSLVEENIERLNAIRIDVDTRAA